MACCATCGDILIFQIIDNGLSRVAAWTPERARQAVVGGPGHRMGETAARAVETARTAAASTAPRTAERGAGWTPVTATATQTLPPVSRTQGQTAEH